MYDLSIIIPFCGNHSFLKDALDSLRHSISESFETIIVEDGCVGAAKSDWLNGLNAKVLSFAEKAGPSRARNKGLAQAHGRYIAFLDSDDMVCRNLLQLVDLANSADIVVGQMSGEKPIPILKDYNSPNHTISALQVPAVMKLNNFTTCLYRRKFLEKQAITFPEDIRFGEDIVFMSNALLHAEKIQLTTFDFYNYRRHNQSLVSERNRLERINSLPRFLDHMLAVCTNKGVAGNIRLLKMFMYQLGLLKKNRALIDSNRFLALTTLIQDHMRDIGDLDKIEELCKIYNIPFVRQNWPILQ